MAPSRSGQVIRRLVRPLLLVVTLAGCLTAEMPKTGWPAEFAPRPGSTDGLLVVQGADEFAMLGGLEGNQPFVSAATRAGERVLNQHFEWPGTTQALPVGQYRVTVYWHSCDGFCNNLDPRGGACAVDAAIREAGRTVVAVNWVGAEMTCRVGGRL